MDTQPQPVEDSRINAPGVLVRAVVEPDGKLRPVDEDFPKLLAAARERSVPRIHAVIVAKNQPLDGLGFVSDPQTPWAFRDPYAEFTVVQAETVTQALELLRIHEARFEIIDCSSDLERKSPFVGRLWLKRKVREFISECEPGYLLLTASPGYGKSAFVADMIRDIRRDTSAPVVFHFIRRNMGDRDKPRRILRSLTGQLRQAYGIVQSEADRQAEPITALINILNRVSRNLGEGQKVLVFLDGLDELSGPVREVLPSRPPEGIRFVLTSRPQTELGCLLSMGCERVDLESTSEGNLDDIEEYLLRENHRRYLELDQPFIDHLVEASGGLFMLAKLYLEGDKSSVIQRLVPWKEDLSLIPRNVQELLESHWRRIVDAAGAKGILENQVSTLLMLLATAREPLSLEHLAKHLLAPSAPKRIGMVRLEGMIDRVEDILGICRQFFATDRADGAKMRYRFFHEEFRDFVVRRNSDKEDDCHRVLAEGCRHWQTLPEALRQYALRHWVFHLRALRQWDEAESLLTDIRFLQDKTEAGLVSDLADDFSALVASTTNDRPMRMILRLLEEAIHRDIQFIARHAQDYPQGLFQCLWNTCWWYDCPEAARYYDPPVDGWADDGPPWRASGPKLFELLEKWRQQKEASAPGMCWLRSHRPPVLPLGGPLVTVLKGHEDALKCVVYSPDGRWIISGSEDNTTRVWDAQSGTEVAVRRGQTTVSSVSCFPDGHRIISGSYDSTIRVWNARTGATLTELRGHEKGVTSVSLCPDGRRIASGSADKTVRVWDAQSGAELLVLYGHEDWVSGVSYSPDGLRIASGSGDKTVRVWDARNGAELAVLHGHKDSVNCVTFSPDGRRIASGSADKTVRVWDAQSGAALAVLRGHRSDVCSVIYAPDGSQIVSGSMDGTIRMWNGQSGAELAVLCHGNESPVRSIAYSSDAHRIASGAWDGALRVWDARHQNRMPVLRGCEIKVRYVRYSPDGRQLACASSEGVVVWDVDSEAELAVLRLDEYDEFVLGVHYLPDGCRIVIHQWFGSPAKVWNPTTGELLESPEHTEASDIAPALVEPFGWRRCGLDVVIEDARTSQPVAWFSQDVDSIAFHPFGQILAACQDGVLNIFSLEGSKAREVR